MKIRYITLIRDYVKGYNIQYIMTVIDSELQRDTKGKRIEFASNEVIKTLDDSGINGLLFKCLNGKATTDLVKLLHNM